MGDAWDSERYGKKLRARFPEVPPEFATHWVSYCNSLTSRQRRQIARDIDDIFAPIHQELKLAGGALAVLSAVWHLVEGELEIDQRRKHAPAGAIDATSTTIFRRAIAGRASDHVAMFLARLTSSDLRAAAVCPAGIPHAVSEEAQSLLKPVIRRLVRSMPPFSVEQFARLKGLESDRHGCMAPSCGFVLTELTRCAASRAQAD